MGKYWKKRGIAIIFVLCIMMGLSALSLSFVRSSNFNRAACANQGAKSEAKLVATSGLQYAISRLREKLKTKPHLIDDEDSCLYPDDSNEDLREASEKGEMLSFCSLDQNDDPELIEGHSYSAKVSGRYGENIYALKIVTNAGKLNINSHIATRRYQYISNYRLKKILRTLALVCDMPPVSAGKVAEIANENFDTSTRLIKNSRRFANRAALRKKVYELLPEEDTAKIEKFLKNLCTDSWINHKTWSVYRDGNSAKFLSDYYQEKRAPVDINYVSKELLRTLILNIRAQVPFYRISVEETTYDIGGVAKKTEKSISDTPKLYDIDFYQYRSSAYKKGQLDTIVNTILQGRPYLDRAYFEKFLDENLDKSLFPSPPHAKIDKDIWKQAWIDALKSNFNPNVIENHNNPNAPAYRKTCKTNFYYGQSGRIYPGHTTELCFHSIGPFEITVLGKVFAHQKVIASHLITTVVTLGDIEYLSLQADFTEPRDRCVSLPNYIYPDVVAGRIEPDITEEKVIPYGGFYFRSFKNNFRENSSLINGTKSCKIDNCFLGGERNDSSLYSTTSKNALKVLDSGFGFHHQSSTFTKQNQTRLFHEVPSVSSGASWIDSDLWITKQRRPSTHYIFNNLARDGIFSHRMLYEDSNSTRYFITHAHSEKSLDSLGDNLRTHPGNRIRYDKGSITFRVKLSHKPGTQDNPGLFHGLLKVSLKNKRLQGEKNSKQESSTGYVSASELRNGAFHEGIQMYVYINSWGVLRCSRIYYGYCFINEYNAIKHYGMGKISSRDANRKFIRKDTEIDVSHWKAHEWHCIRLGWNDSREMFALYADDKRASITYEMPLKGTMEFAVLNEVDPRDSLFVNGYYRKQAISGGYHQTGSVINRSGNATISCFQPHNYMLISSPIDYHYHDTTYRGKLKVRKKGILGPMFWTGYSGMHNDQGDYEGSNSSSVSCETLYHKKNANDDKKMSWCGVTKDTLLAKGDVLDYTVKFHLGTLKNKGLEVPSFDSISFVFFHITPKFLSFEEQ